MAETIQGLQQFERKLSSLTLAVQRKGLTKAVRDGGTLIAEAASRNIRSEGLVLTGNLAEREIVTIVQSQSNAFSILARIGPAQDAFYGRFPEFGTIFEPETPFLGPAFDESVGPAINLTSKILKQIVESA